MATSDEGVQSARVIHLLRDSAFEYHVPFRELSCLILNSIMKSFLTEHRAHARQERRMVEWLRQVIVSSGLKALDDVSGICPRCHKDHWDCAERRIVP